MPPLPSPARLTVVTMVATAVLALALPTAAAAVEAQGIRMDPAEPSAIGAGSAFRPAIPPGGTATYVLVLRNQHDEEVEVLVYGADLGDDGQVASGTDNTGVGTWIATATPRVTLGAQATATVAVTISRPAGDADGGTGFVVAQLAERSRQDLGLDGIRRAALPVVVAPDGRGDGVHVEVTGQDASGGLVPGVLTVELTFTNPGEDEVAFDGALHLVRRLGGDESLEATTDTVAPAGQLTREVEVELPWYGVIGHVRAEAATVPVTTASRPVRVVVVPPWAVLPLLLAAIWTVFRAWRPDRRWFPLR